MSEETLDMELDGVQDETLDSQEQTFESDDLTEGFDETTTNAATTEEDLGDFGTENLGEFGIEDEGTIDLGEFAVEEKREDLTQELSGFAKCFPDWALEPPQK